MNVEFFGCSIRVTGDHPLLPQIREGFPYWKSLHEFGGKFVGMLAERELGSVSFRLAPGEEANTDFWVDFYDTLTAFARSWKESNDFVEAEVEFGGITATLCRSNRSRLHVDHYEKADLSFTTAHGVVEFPELLVAELKRLGAFVIDYAESMETANRDV